MAINLLEQLMNKSQIASEDVASAKTDLGETLVVTLEGVNAPEFEDSVPFDMEDAYASQPTTPISIPVHDDGLDDEEESLTTDHVDFGATSEDQEDEDEYDCDLTEAPTKDSAPEAVEVLTQETAPEAVEETEEMIDAAEHVYGENVELGEDGEPILWNLKPFNSRYFNFGGRTVNSLTRAGYRCFDDIKEMAYSELKALKGFGQGCLDEMLDLLEAENQSDWLLKRKKKSTAANTEDQEVVNTEDDSVADHILSIGDIEDYSADQASEEAPEVVDFTNDPAPVEDNSGSAESEVPTPVESAPQVVSPKILAIGGSVSLSRPGLQVASFEMVYAEAIRVICQQSSAPSIASIEFGKGWGALATTIRMNGWPQGVDVLTVSKSFMGRSEVVMELRLLADLVLEA